MCVCAGWLCLGTELRLSKYMFHRPEMEPGERTAIYCLSLTHTHTLSLSYFSHTHSLSQALTYVHLYCWLQILENLQTSSKDNLDMPGPLRYPCAYLVFAYRLPSFSLRFVYTLTVGFTSESA